MTRTLWITAIAAAAVLDTSGAVGEPICGTRADALNALAKNHKEAPAFVGLAAGGYRVEVLTSDDSSTWTILLSKPDGQRTCLLDAGEAWQSVERKPVEGPAL